MPEYRRTALAAFLFMFYSANLALAQTPKEQWMLGPFERPADSHPIIKPQPEATFTDPITQKPVHWEALHTFNPAAVVRNGKVIVLYRAEDNSGTMAIGEHTSRLGMAESDDGIHFKQMSEPVFYPANDGQKSREWPGGVEDPRIAETEDGMYVLTYTQWNRQTYSVGVATSRDLTHWTKYGPAFGTSGKYASLKYKSAGIVTQLKDGHLVAARIHGKYWMYWGEVKVGLASSTDLIHWTPVEDKSGTPLLLLATRSGKFDSALPEVGAPPLLTKDGILLLYNGKNSDTDGDKSLQAGTYSTGQALFSADHPEKLLHRNDTPFLTPKMPFERSGQYAAGTTFIESLVYFHQKWFAYYGCADSFVGVVFSGQ
ncbi:glycoside hydrolase family 130 protein [Silvibacterium acidisoli]|uniref:glycoside hydrolase family 130 protein n=1 Tax=Acidobacteriaceae bacterium ZG23-2 TaxID=2883246 RepID=UPI00406C5349